MKFTLVSSSESSFCSVDLSSALMYSPLESIIGHYRGEQDSLNSVAAATLTGVMYKSTGKGLISLVPRPHPAHGEEKGSGVTTPNPWASGSTEAL